MLEIKNTVIKLKNAFNGLISKLYMAKERISELKDMPVETYQTEIQRGKRKNEKKRTDCPTIMRI